MGRVSVIICVNQWLIKERSLGVVGEIRVNQWLISNENKIGMGGWVIREYLCKLVTNKNIILHFYL
jgi:hypothetical protein